MHDSLAALCIKMQTQRVHVGGIEEVDPILESLADEGPARRRLRHRVVCPARPYVSCQVRHRSAWAPAGLPCRPPLKDRSSEVSARCRTTFHTHAGGGSLA